MARKLSLSAVFKARDDLSRVVGKMHGRVDRFLGAANRRLASIAPGVAAGWWAC